MDEFGEDFGGIVKKATQVERQHQETCTSTDSLITETPQTTEQPCKSPQQLQSVDKGRKIVFDNFDFKQKVHEMSENHQNVDKHWVTHVAVENRVHQPNLSNQKPSKEKLLSMENGFCLPNQHEHNLQRENYIALTERVIVDLPCLEFLKPHVVKHIPHQFTREMAQRSKMVCY